MSQYTRDLLVDDVIAHGGKVYVRAYISSDIESRLWRVADDAQLHPLDAASHRPAGRLAVVGDTLVWSEDEKAAGLGPFVSRRRIVCWNGGDAAPTTIFEDGRGILGPVAGPETMWVTTGRQLARGHRAENLVELDELGGEVRRLALPDPSWDMQPLFANDRFVVVRGRVGRDPDQAAAASFVIGVTSGTTVRVDPWNPLAVTIDGDLLMSQPYRAPDRTVLATIGPGRTSTTLGVMSIGFPDRGAMSDFTPTADPHAMFELDTSTVVEYAAAPSTTSTDPVGRPTVRARDGLTVDDDLFDNLDVGVLVVRGDRPVELLERVIAAVLMVKHPEEPADPFAAYVSSVEERQGAAMCTFDFADLSAYPDVRAEIFDAIVRTANASTGHVTIATEL